MIIMIYPLMVPLEDADSTLNKLTTLMRWTKVQHVHYMILLNIELPIPEIV